MCGQRPTGAAANGFIHLINSGAAALDGTGLAGGMMKKWWDMADADIDACLSVTDWKPANLSYFRGGGFSSHWKTQAEMPVTIDAPQQRAGSRSPRSRREQPAFCPMRSTTPLTNAPIPRGRPHGLRPA
ncbi:MAG: hypothetical protein QM689_01305 [Oscillospiraceae bacterium]